MDIAHEIGRICVHYDGGDITGFEPMCIGAICQQIHRYEVRFGETRQPFGHLGGLLDHFGDFDVGALNRLFSGILSGRTQAESGCACS